jgi:hypothetical protein
VLNTLPETNVTVYLNSSDTTEGTVSPSSVIFTPTDSATQVRIPAVMGTILMAGPQHHHLLLHFSVLMNTRGMMVILLLHHRIPIGLLPPIIGLIFRPLKCLKKLLISV